MRYFRVFFFTGLYILNGKICSQTIKYTPSLSNVNFRDRAKAAMLITLLKNFEFKESSGTGGAFVIYYLGKTEDKLFKELSEIASTRTMWGKPIVIKAIDNPQQDISSASVILVSNSNTGQQVFKKISANSVLKKAIVVFDGQIYENSPYDIGISFNSVEPVFHIKKNEIKRKNIGINEQIFSFKQVKEVK